MSVWKRGEGGGGISLRPPSIMPALHSFMHLQITQTTFDITGSSVTCQHGAGAAQTVAEQGCRVGWRQLGLLRQLCRPLPIVQHNFIHESTRRQCQDTGL